MNAGLIAGAAAVALYVVRYRKILRSLRSLKMRPVETKPLLVIAPLLPFGEACRWIADFEGQLADLEPWQRREVRLSIARSFLGLMRAAWAAWAATRLNVVRELASWLTARWMLPRISRVNALLGSRVPVWPQHEEQHSQLQRQIRTLRFWARLLTRCVSERLHPKIVTHAAWLAESCARLLAEQARADLEPPADRLPLPKEAALMLEINHMTMTTTELVKALAGSRTSWGRRIGRQA